MTTRMAGFLRITRLREIAPLLLAACLLLPALTGCQGPKGSGAPGPAPARVDLTTRPWFPPAAAQQGNSCSQLAGIYYLLATAESRERGGPRVALSPYAAYATLAESMTGNTHVVDGWLLAKETGAPLYADAPRGSRGLPHGFDKYVRALSHRPAGWRFLPLRTEADLEAVKRALANGEPVACDFQMKGAKLGRAAAGGARAGETIVTEWGTTGPGHAMIYAGYDDEVGFDFNNDGRLTNDIDIDGDGRVTLADREKGAFLLINPWGPRWGQGGRAWAPYREHALRSWPRAGEVAVVEAARKPEPPRVMLKLRLQLRERAGLVIRAGAARDKSAAAPDRVWEPLPFRRAAVPFPSGRKPSTWEVFAKLHRPGPHLSAGPLAAPDGGPLEMGLDLTPLDGKAGRWFLELESAAGTPLDGVLAGAWIVKLDRSGRPKEEIPFAGLPARLSGGGGRWTAED